MRSELKSLKLTELPATIKIAVVDDHKLFRAGVIALLSDYSDMEVVLEASNGKDLFTQLKRHTPHVVLLDIEMPEMNGIETTLLLKKQYPRIKIIILTMHSDEEFIFDLMNKGANGFLPKDKSVEAVVEAIYCVMKKGYYYNDQITAAIIKGNSGGLKAAQLLKSAALSEREIEIVKLICEQKTNKEIGDQLSISARTVDNHKNNIFLKIGTNTTIGIVMFALHAKLIND
jgi:DNA-binding NarL/FixJ family response regulator